MTDRVAHHLALRISTYECELVGCFCKGDFAETLYKFIECKSEFDGYINALEDNNLITREDIADAYNTFWNTMNKTFNLESLLTNEEEYIKEFIKYLQNNYAD